MHAACRLVERIARMDGRLHAHPGVALGLHIVKAIGKCGYGDKMVASDARGDIAGEVPRIEVEGLAQGVD